MNKAKQKILGVIPARGGSKSIPGKNIFPCAGYPLIYYTIQAAKNSRLISRLIISTDSKDIAETARNLGVEVPFMRPKDLAKDDTPDLPVFQHALAWLKEKEGYEPDVIVHLRSTTPLKSAVDIDKGIELLLKNPDADSVRSVCRPLHTPFKMYKLEAGDKFLKSLLSKVYPEVFEKYPEAFNMPRQLLPQVWRHSGYVDVIRPQVITERSSMSGTKILPLFFEEWRDVDIDSLKELKWAEELINDLRKKGQEVWN